MRNKNVLMVMVMLIIFSFENLAYSANETTSLPKSHIISDVPYHKQETAFSCGPAALEILYDFWGVDVDQNAIANVARSSSIGTYTWDMVRSGFFSHLSSSQGKFFPRNAPKAGYPERPLGYISFDYSSDTFWWPTLKELLARDIPVVLLMNFASNDDTGHYRVIVGYDEDKEVVYFVDPWGRDLNKKTNLDGTITWSMTDFANAWNYIGYGTTHPYWGTVMMPWMVTIHTNGETTAGSVLEVTAEITYPCPQPFDCSAYSASNIGAEIILPPGMYVLGGSPRVDIGELQAGETATVIWNVKLDADGSGTSITVKATGLVSGAVPEVGKNNKKADKDNDKNGNRNSYPPYTYTDEVGVEESIEL